MYYLPLKLSHPCFSTGKRVSICDIVYNNGCLGTPEIEYDGENMKKPIQILQMLMKITMRELRSAECSKSTYL